jgi:hypothetical protein
MWLYVAFRHHRDFPIRCSLGASTNVCIGKVADSKCCPSRLITTVGVSEVLMAMAMAMAMEKVDHRVGAQVN